jgi:hypothetical protein
VEINLLRASTCALLAECRGLRFWWWWLGVLDRPLGHLFLASSMYHIPKPILPFAPIVTIRNTLPLTIRESLGINLMRAVADDFGNSPRYHGLTI